LTVEALKIGHLTKVETVIFDALITLVLLCELFIVFAVIVFAVIVVVDILLGENDCADNELKLPCEQFIVVKSPVTI
jgi:hypothetical protein